MMNYTPQQQMGFGGYSVPCRVGNWQEDEYLGVLHTADHMAKEETGVLTTQKLGGVISSALAPATLAPPPADGVVRFGDVVMITAASGGALALNATKKLELSQEAYALSRTSVEGTVPCVRTAWTIEPCGLLPEDGMLRIGDRFQLTTTGADGGTLYLESLRYTLMNQNFSSGVEYAQRKQAVSAVRAPSADTVWQASVLEPTAVAQFESVGKPVLANTYVSLLHVNTQQMLASVDTPLLSKFGPEFEVTCFTDGGIAKGQWGQRTGSVAVSNHWAFTTAA